VVVLITLESKQLRLYLTEYDDDDDDDDDDDNENVLYSFFNCSATCGS
jgi:hypothetical protein